MSYALAKPYTVWGTGDIPAHVLKDGPLLLGSPGIDYSDKYSGRDWFMGLTSLLDS